MNRIENVNPYTAKGNGGQIKVEFQLPVDLSLGGKPKEPPRLVPPERF
ncbi:MAG: hypothetical protein GX443_14060 [Deltaproteobacteria bacterium]|nr:hypothetical protein [Deltaproteobacteria bacterium]